MGAVARIRLIISYSNPIFWSYEVNTKEMVNKYDFVSLTLLL